MRGPTDFAGRGAFTPTLALPRSAQGRGPETAPLLPELRGHAAIRINKGV